MFTALIAALFSTTVCTVALNQLPASGGSGPAVVSYQNVDTGERTADAGTCRVVEARDSNAERDEDPAK